MLKKAFAAATAAFVLGVGSAYAQMVTLVGDTVEFTFDSGALGSLFGGFSVSGDSLVFDPTTFIAQATGPGIQITSATTPSITVTPKAGFFATGVSLFEQGDYFRIESGGGTTLVGAGGQFIVNNMPYSLTAGGLGAYQTPMDVTMNGLVTSPWTISQVVSFAQTVDGTSVKLQNILIAGITGGLEAAFIEKKLLTITGVTVPIPEPETWALFIVGLGLLGLQLRKRLL